MTLTKLFFFQAEDGIRDVERSRGLGDVYKRQLTVFALFEPASGFRIIVVAGTDV